MDQVTPVLVDPLTVAFRVVDCPPESDAEDGETETDTGTNEMLAVSLLVLSAALVAFTTTVCAEEMVGGAL
jgi:hypothetical protein